MCGVTLRYFLAQGLRLWAYMSGLLIDPLATAVNHPIRPVEPAGRAVLNGHTVLLRPFVHLRPFMPALAALERHAEAAMLGRVASVRHRS